MPLVRSNVTSRKLVLVWLVSAVILSPSSSICVKLRVATAKQFVFVDLYSLYIQYM